MGIPSYFSYIVKNHAKIIKKISSAKIVANNLYLDCNSIIYDVVHTSDLSKIDTDNTNLIITNVCNKIDEYVSKINPTDTVYIAFDGVAPVAKLDQQRQRRYKSLYQNDISRSIYKSTKPDVWNTTAITPGTKFMKQLNDTINKKYDNIVKHAEFNVKNIIVSGSDHPGEGEHKLFEYIRETPEKHKDENTIIYGLDADLIMLSINHLPIAKNIFLYRETPHFIQSINSDLEPNEDYLLDIPELANIITLDMNNGEELSSVQHHNRIYDYIFLCFFLGNDFMPHFPSANIRTGGVDKILDAYKRTIGNTQENLTDGKTIYWKNVRKLVKDLADNEEEFLKREKKQRDKKERMLVPNITPEEKYKKFESLPTYDRAVEKFINPFSPNWQVRYYKSLFNVDIDDVRRKQICVNYLEGLEWTMKYYTQGCYDWRWCYNYNYPPLFCDLLQHIPFFETEFVERKPANPVTELVQLCYVLPKQSLYLLPEKLFNNLTTTRSDWYDSNCTFTWAYCRYFWESHVNLPHVDIDELELFVKNNV